MRLHKQNCPVCDPRGKPHMVNAPRGAEWTYEIKLDGYRLEVVRRGRETTLYSLRQNLFNQKC